MSLVRGVLFSVLEDNLEHFQASMGKKPFWIEFLNEQNINLSTSNFRDYPLQPNNFLHVQTIFDVDRSGCTLFYVFLVDFRFKMTTKEIKKNLMYLAHIFLDTVYL